MGPTFGWILYNHKTGVSSSSKKIEIEISNSKIKKSFHNPHFAFGIQNNSERRSPLEGH